MMAVISWEEGYSVQRTELDEQHMQMLTMVNTVYDMMTSGNAKESLLPMLNEIAEVTKDHFSKEESYMGENNYPQYNSHVKKHTHFIKKILKGQKELESGQLMSSREIMKDIAHGLVDHIRRVDAEYAKLISAQGLK